ncbi:hypothetical protein T11_5430 [Trichinella zimbabwensis]|uniref:Uncharacterized protein n=1 Tax=Trichinella zimbabwensis TaxID=268475 RepID=A0A0V1GAH8_9BILA|nr:hypothetical protein T11_5430 [Trichinella zimbabwensis]
MEKQSVHRHMGLHRSHRDGSSKKKIQINALHSER